jgi:plastocyanin
MRRRFRRLIVLAATAALVVVAGPPAQAATVIQAIDVRFAPRSVTVQRGDTVKWLGVSGFHDVVAYGHDWSFSKQLPAGGRVKLRFRVVGVFRFRCIYHSNLIGGVCSGMCGTITVTARVPQSRAAPAS